MLVVTSEVEISNDRIFICSIKAILGALNVQKISNFVFDRLQLKYDDISTWGVIFGHKYLSEGHFLKL